MIYYTFVEDIINFPFMQRALLMAIFIGIVTGVLGSFIILSGKSLMGEAISHAILPGVVISYMLGINYFIGALLMGLLATYLMSKISQKSKINSDVSIGIVFTSFFSIGLILLLKAQTSVDLNNILFGNILTITKSNMYLTIVIGLIVLITIIVFYKAFLITIFDPTIGKSFGFNIKFFEHLLMVLLTLVVVSSLQAVGVILVVSMLITPAASAYLWTKDFKKMIILSSIFGSLGGVIGLYFSTTFNLSSGATIVLVLAFIFIISYLFAKEDGILIKKIKLRKGDLNEKK